MTSEHQIALSRCARGAAPGASPGSAWRQLHSALVTCASAAAIGLATLLGCPSQAQAAQGDRTRQLTLYVTDRGIDQMRHWETGREQGLTWTMSNLDPAARIAVVMPREDFSSAVLRQKIYDDLKQRVDAALQSGRSELEIQLVQDVSKAGYFAPWRQGEAEEFGAAAYAAIRDINVYLERQSIRVTNHAKLGSNGSVVFAANIDAWSKGGRAIWASVDIFDGRAFLAPMVKAIGRIGPKRVRIFNTSLDLPAPYTPWTLRSLGNAASGQLLKTKYFPDLKVYRLSSVKGAWGHIAGMLDSAQFLVDEFVSRELGYKPLPGIVGGAALRRPNGLPAALDRSIPADVKEGVAVWKSVARDLVEALGSYADGFAEKHGEKHPLARPVRDVARVAKVMQALNEDISEARDSHVAILKSRTIEELLNFVVEEVATSARLHQKYGKDVKGYTASVSALIEFFRSGKPNAEVVENISAAAAVAAQRRLGEAHAADFAKHTAKLDRLQRDTARLEHHAQKLSVALHLGSGDRNIDLGRQAQLRKVSDQLTRATRELGDVRVAARIAQDRLIVASVGLDVLPEFAAAIAVHVTQRRLSVDVVDRYSDALLALTGSLVAAVFATANPELAAYAPVVKETVVAAGTWVRDVPVRALFDRSSMWEALDAYLVYQSQAVREGKEVQTFSAFYGFDNLRSVGFSKRQIADQDDQARRLNEAAAAQRESAAMASAGGGTPDRKRRTPAKEIHTKEPEKPEPPYVESRKPYRHSSSLPPPGGGQNPPNIEGGPPGGSPAGAAATDDRGPCSPGSNRCGGIDLGLTALVVDPAARKLVILAEGGTPRTEAVESDLMALALWLEYTGQRAAFSLDPYDSQNPRGPWLRAAYFPEALRGTVVGNQCFDADFLLKQASFGVRVEGDRVVEHRSESGLVSVPELMGKRTGPSPEQWSRMWIVSREVRLTASDGIVRVELAKMGVEARRQVPDPSTRSGLRDVATPSEAVEQQFARQFEALYDRLAATEARSLAAVREATKALALARWLKWQGVRIDMEAVVAQLNRARVPAVDKVSALSVGWTSQTQQPYSDSRGSGVVTTTHKLHVFGGIDLSVDPKVTKGGRDDSLRDAVGARLRQPNAPPKFELAHAGRVYRAYVMPFQVVGNQGR